jgi:hypothetical protein
MLVVAVAATLAAAAGIGVRSTYGAAAAVDEPQYLLSALSLAEDGDLDIADELAARRWSAYAAAQLPVQTATLDGGRQLSPHDPLLPLLLAPAVGLGGWVAAKIQLALLAGAVAAMALWLAVRRFAVPPKLAVTGVTLAAVSAPLAGYGQQVYPELPAALAVLISVAALTGRLRGGGVVALAAAVVALPWLSVKYVPIAAVLAATGLVLLLRSGRARAAALTAIALSACSAAYLVVHRAVWGGWTVYASGDHFTATGELSVVGTDPDYAGRSLRLVGLLVDRGYGLVAWQPAWLLAVPAVAALCRAKPPGWAALVVPLAVGWLVATFPALTMHGFWWPGRQVVVVLPLAVVGVLWWLARAVRPVRVAGLLLGLAGVVTYAALLLDGWAGELTWVVGFEQVDDPLYAVRRLLLPDYRTGGPGLWVRHGAWVAAVGALAVAGWRSVRQREYADPCPPAARSTVPVALSTGGSR